MIWEFLLYLDLNKMEQNVVLYEDLDEVPLNRNVLLVTGIEETKEWFRRMDWIENPEINTIPIELNEYKFLKRHIKYSTLEEVRNTTNFPIFIKPVNLKQFNAGVINNIHQIGWIEPNLNDNIPIIISDVLNIISEYRCYIIDGKCVGIYNYLGDIYKFPNSELIKEMLFYCSEFDTFSLDVGILDTGETVLVECNDFWSLGNYGLSPKLYCRGLMTRWRQLLDINKIR